MSTFIYTHESYLQSQPSCDWGWCAEDATEGCVQRYEHEREDGTGTSVTLSISPYCARHAELNRQCIASAARQAAARAG